MSERFLECNLDTTTGVTCEGAYYCAVMKGFSKLRHDKA